MFTLISDYITSRSGSMSLLNSSARQFIQQDDYVYILLSDKYRYRLDRLAKDLLGDEKLYILIMLINDIKSLDEIDHETTIKLPTKDFIQRYRDEMRIERGIT